jgi:hypothetical protein
MGNINIDALKTVAAYHSSSVVTFVRRVGDLNDLLIEFEDNGHKLDRAAKDKAGKMIRETKSFVANEVLNLNDIARKIKNCPPVLAGAYQMNDGKIANVCLEYLRQTERRSQEAAFSRSVG